MALFHETLQIRGKHADMARRLTTVLNCYNYDIVYASVVLGLWQKRLVEIDTETNVEPVKIELGQILKYSDDLRYFYQMVMLCDKKYCIDASERVNKALKYIDTPEAEEDEIHFIEIMLGGLEFLFEQIFKAQSFANPNPTEVFDSISKLVEHYKNIYN